MHIHEGYLLREVGGECVLFPVGQNVVDSKKIIGLNETAKYIVEKLQQETTREEILAGLIEEYEAETEGERTLLRLDLDYFLKCLREQDLLVDE